jgi:hypothetical protein
MQHGIFTILFVDDCSDYTRSQKQYIARRLKHHVTIFNNERKYAIRNAYEVLHTYVKKNDAIILNVDGDDWLAHDNVLSSLERVYTKSHCLLTYGNCQYYSPNTKLHALPASYNSQINHRYPHDVEQRNAYRKYFFIPLHLRTWQHSLFKQIHKSSFLRPDGSWQRSCEDQAMYLPMLEMAYGRYEVIHDIHYVYNRENVLNENKTNLYDLLLDEVTILRQKPYLAI